MTQTGTLIILLLGVLAILYYAAKQRAVASVGGLAGVRTLHSLPRYYGVYAMLWAAIPAAVALLGWSFFEEPIVTELVVAKEIGR